MGRTGWGTTLGKEWRSKQRKWRRDQLWKRRAVEKSKTRLFHRTWKSRKVRGIPTFPQLRRLREINLNRTFHLLRKPDILISYEHGDPPQNQRPVGVFTCLAQ